MEHVGASVDQDAGVEKSRRMTGPAQDKPEGRRSRYHWQAEDVESMPADAFQIWYENVVVPAILSGRKSCGTPSDTGKGNLVAFRAAKTRARREGLHVPAPSRARPKMVSIDGPKLAAACRRRAGAMSLPEVARVVGLDTSTLAPIFAGTRIALYRSTLETLCVWLDKKPVVFER